MNLPVKPTIEYIQITLKPWHFSDRPEKIIEVTLQVNDQRYKFEKILPPTDFDSFFDQIMGMAKGHFERAVKGESLPQFIDFDGKTQTKI